MSHHPPRAARAGLCAAVILALALCEWHVRRATGQALPDIQYRRVTVPHDAMESQIRGLLPLQRDEFERRLRLATVSAAPRTNSAAVRIDHARFTAQLAGGQLQGTAELAIVSDAGEPSLLTLQPCNVAVSSAAWREPEASSAVLGIDPEGQLRCLVPQSGTLHWNWTAPAVETRPQQTTFVLRLPAAPRRTLEVAAPADYEIAVNEGIVVPLPMASGGEAIRRWMIELPGSPEVRLFVRPVQKAHNAQPLMIVRESSSYSVLPATIDLETTFLLDFPALPATRLDLLAGTGLRVTGVQLDGERLNFSSSAVAAAEATSIEIELPREILGWRRTLQVTATADWPLESRWMLPRMAVAEGVLQEGSVTIAAPAWLRLQARASAGCVLSAVTPASAGRASDQFQFQVYDAGGSIEIASDKAPPPLREASGIQIVVDAAQIKGVLVADLSTLGGDSFTMEATVPRHWIVDSVETQPPEALADRVLAPRGPAQQLLRLNLTRPVSASRNVQLIVRAHTRRPANGQRLPDGFFSLARFLGVRESRRLVAVQIDEPDAELTLTTDRGLARLDPRQLTSADLQLFETPPGGLLVELDDADAAIDGTFTATTARYQADAVVAVRAEETSLRQHVSIRCQPDASAVNSVLVRLAPRPTGPVAWRLEGDPQPELTARIETPGTEAGGATSDAILYRLVLPRARSSAFEISGEWSSGDAPTGAISLAWLPEANVQTGILELHGSSPASFVVAAEEVQSLPIPATPNNAFSTLRARYRYDASRRARVTVHPAPPGTTQRGAWISALQVTSYFADGGHAQHEATLTVENAGLRQVQVRFERTVSDLRLVDEAGAETPRPSPAAAGVYSLPLPIDSRTAKLRLRYSAPARSAKPWLYGSLSAPVPAVDLPVLIRRWQVGLPPGLSVFVKRDAAHGDNRLSPTEEITNSDSVWNTIAGPAWGRKLLTTRQPVDEALDPAFAGWTIVSAELPTGPAATILVYRAAVVRAWSLCLALVAAAATAMIAPRGLWLGRTIALLVAAALFMSPPIAWPLAGVCSGMLLGGWFAFWRPRSRGGRSGTVATAPASTLLAPAVGAAGLLILLALPAAELLGAPHENPGASLAKRPRVVIPVDDDQQPVGDYVYLEPAFYEALHRRSESSLAATTPWLIGSATYEFPVMPRANEAAAVVDEFRAVYEFYTFLPSALLRLPLARDQIVLREGQARLDGQAVSLDWQPDGKALTLPVAAAGKHRLELSLGALARRTPEALVLELSLPRAPQSVVSLPAGGEAVVESAAGSFPVTARATSGVTLAATDRLSIRWPYSGGDSAAAGLLADQFLWWKIRPGSVVLEGKFRLQPIGGDAREAVIAADPRLRLLPGALTAGRITIEEGSQQLVKVQLAEPTNGPVELRLSWLWPEVTGLGTLHLPQVQVRADRLDRQWMAVSAMDGLQLETPAGPGSISSAAFLQIWGESTASPGIAWGARAEEQPLPIIVRPENRLPRVEQAIDWSLSASAAAAHVAMQLTQVPESRFEHRLAMPPQLKVASVKLIQDGKTAALRWGQQPDGLLVVTLLEPPGREQELLVSAETALASQRLRFPLAATSVQGAELESSVMRIYRQTDVGVELQSPAGWTEQDDPEIGKHRAGLGRLVATLRNEAAIGDTQPVVSRWSNRPQVTGVEFIRAHEDDGDWRADVELSLEVAGGVVDELRLAIPDQWSGPLELEPPLEHRIIDLPGERRRLIIRPTRALADRLQLSIRGPLQSSEAGLAAPDVRLLDAPAVERLVLLDRGRSGQQIDWETTGLVAAEAGSTPLPARWHGVAGELLRVVAPRFDARARPRQERAATPRAHLAEVQITLDATGRLAAVSRYTIRPAGARTVAWIMPPDCRLVQALVDGGAVTCASRGPRTWELTAPSAVLPFELTIVYDGAVAPSQQPQSLLQLAAPRLVGVQVEQTLWRIDGGGQRLGMPANTVVATASARQAAVMRLEAAARGLEDAAAARSADVLNSVLSQIEARWLAIYNDAQSRLPAPDAIDGASERLLSAREDAAQAIALRARQRLSVTEAVANAQSPAAVAAINEASAGAAWFSGAGPAEELALSVDPSASDKLDVNRLLAFLLVGLAAAMGPLSRVRPACDWFSAHAHLVLALVGIVWWLIAPLGWLGWLLVAAGLLRSLRFPGARPAQQASWSSQRSRAGAA